MSVVNAANLNVVPPRPVRQPRRIPVGFGYYIIIEARFVLLNMAALTLYLFAAYIANEWIYLLAAGFCVANILGLTIPCLQLFDVEALCSMPDETLVSDRADVQIGLRRTLKLGLITAIIPLQSVRLTVDLLRRTPSGKGESVLAPEPVLIQHIFGEYWFNFPTTSLRRGVYYLRNVELISCFPLGLIWWCRKLSIKKDGSDRKITVHPSVSPISGNFLHKIGGINSLMGIASATSVVTTHSTSVRSVREFRTGDSLRHIHWASTAKTGKVLVREFDSEVLPVYDLMIDLTANWRSTDQFELAVLLLHSLVHLGYGLGVLPELSLHPAIDSRAVCHLMSDLPQIPRSIAWLSEVLARVEPLTLADVPREERSEADTAKAVAGLIDRPLLSIVPAAEGVMKYLPGRGDTIVYPLRLVLVDRHGYSVDAAKSAQTKAPVAKSGRPQPTASQELSLSELLANATVIAEFDTVAEIIAL